MLAYVICYCEKKDETMTYISNLTDTITYESKHFLLRLVAEEDAEDLLECYADPEAQKYFNHDPAANGDYFKDCDEQLVLDMIRSWRKEFERKSWVRFSILDKQRGKAVGTIEMYDKLARENRSKYAGWSVLRIDIASAYEKAECIGELLRLFDEVNFFELFNVNIILTKAIPQATERRKALQDAGYTPFEWDEANRKCYRRKNKG